MLAYKLAAITHSSQQSRSRSIDLNKDFNVKLTQIISAITISGALTFSATALAQNSSPFSPDQVAQIKQVVHDYLVGNPQVLVEASQALQKQELQKVEQKAQSAISDNAKIIFDDPASPVSGNPKGDVSVVEFFDYQCPHCKDMEAVLDKIRTSDPNVRIIFKELPIFGSSSRDAALAALAANLQGPDAYLKLHNALLLETNPLTKDKIMQIAKSAGINIDKLSKDMKSDALQKQIDDNFKLAQNLGLMGTPTFIISKWQIGNNNNSVQNAAFVPGVVTVENLQDLIAQARKQ